MTLKRIHQSLILAVTAALAGGAGSTVRANPVYKVTNVSPSPTLTNEFWLTATNITTLINGTNVHVMVYMDDPPGGGGAPPQLPCPLIEVGVGQMVVCHFQNKLTNNIEGVSIHWHGIELDNDSDGTAVTQDTVFPGQTYTYRYVPPRAGLFWYHSHMLPGTTVFGGMYGPLIVTNAVEGSLIASNILPPSTYTFPLVMGDTSFTNGVIGKVFNGTNYALNTLIQMCENAALGISSAGGGACGVAGPPGDVVLVNGTVPSLAGTFCAPATNSAPIYYIGKNQRIRLQLFNESISRDFYLTLHYPCSNPSGDTNLYHIGGQGGLLDNAVLDGGVQSGYDFLYKHGTVAIGTGMREDVMFYSSGNNGDVIQLVGNPLPAPWKLSGGFSANYPIAFFVVTNGGTSNAPLAAGSPILTAAGMTTENLRLLNTNAIFLPPSPALGTNVGVVSLQNNLVENSATNIFTNGGSPNIGGYAATALDGNTGYGSWQSVPHPPTAIWGRIGDVLQLAVANNTGGAVAGGTAMHPYHLHGFSMQPVAIYSANLVTNLYNFPYNEFVDTYEVYPGQALVFRIHLTDRPRYADSATGGPVTVEQDSPTGGGVGRWLMHCHIFLHGTIGMISELVVVSNSVVRTEGPGAGVDSVTFAGSPGTPWTASTNAPWLHLSAPNQAGTGSTNVIFSFDANPGATRTGIVTVGGETVNVTQAGTSFVSAQPMTALASGFNQPANLAVDTNGNVYIADRGNNVIKEWSPAFNTVSTPIFSGLSAPEGIAVDPLGNVYIANGDSSIKKWSPTSGLLTTLTSSGISGPSGLALDQAGNVYVALPSLGAIKEWHVADGSVTTVVSSGLNSPYGVAVDVAGNVYIANTYGNSVYVWNAVNHILSPLVTTGLSFPWNVTVDDGGNVYIADGGNNDIKEWVAATGNVVTLATGISDSTDVAVDPLHNVYISDFGNNVVRELPWAFVDLTTQNIPADGGNEYFTPVLPLAENLSPPFFPTTNQPWLDVFGTGAGGVIGYFVSPNPGSARAGALNVLGQNITIQQQGATFTLGTGTLLQGPAAGSNTVVLAADPAVATWTASSLAAWLHVSPGYSSGIGSTNFVFTYDTNPGTTRTGQLNIAGQLLTVVQAGSTYVPAPQPVTLVVSNGLNSPTSVAVDGGGDLFVSDSGNSAVKEWVEPANSVSTLFTNGLSTPQGVAVDPAGNVYVADFYSSSIKKWIVGGTNVQTLVSNLAIPPAGVALDAATNVYWASPGDGAVKEWVASTGLYGTIIRGLVGPYGLALDAARNVYVADTSANSIKEWSFVNHSIRVLATNGINSPWNVAVDGCGNVYIANGYNNDLRAWIAVNSNLVVLAPSGFSDPTGVAVDGFQNVYIADYGNNAIKELPRAFVDPTPKSEPYAAGSDVLPVVLLQGENLGAPFAPTSDQPWLAIAGVTGGVVSFNFGVNTNMLPRTANINLLGQNIPITQGGKLYPPTLINAKILTNGVFQFGFTNGTPGATFSVLFSTNVATPLTNWAVIGAASNITPNLLQFTDLNATNMTRFYMVRSP
jgi:FtsP/CotA-like multicopper oxidase with cupredoxin domain/streptogramin lyase